MNAEKRKQKELQNERKIIAKLDDKEQEDPFRDNCSAVKQLN